MDIDKINSLYYQHKNKLLKEQNEQETDEVPLQYRYVPYIQSSQSISPENKQLAQKLVNVIVKENQDHTRSKHKELHKAIYNLIRFYFDPSLKDPQGNWKNLDNKKASNEAVIEQIAGELTAADLLRKAANV